MKPSFALNLNDDSIGLLQRAPNGWLSIGSVQFDHPDLASALMELRDSVSGLGTQNLAAKLVIPNSQILYATLSAPGPNAALRRAQIAAALEGLTPYRVDELVFDWSGTGEEVQVAAVARETLSEAEGFALEHGFKAVSFIAIPPEGSFAAEPWFGQTASAVDFLADGEKVVRDQDPIRIIPSKGFALAPQLTEPAVPRQAIAPEPAPLAPEPVAVAEPTPAIVSAPDAEPPVADQAEPPAAEIEPLPAVPPSEAVTVETEATPTPETAPSVATVSVADPVPNDAPAAAPIAAPPAVASVTPEPAAVTERPSAPVATRNAALAGAAPSVMSTKAPEPVGKEQVAAKLAASLAKQVRPSDAPAAAVPETEAPIADDAALTLSWPGEDDSAQMASTKAALAASLAPVQTDAEAALVAGIRSDLAPLPTKPGPSAPARPAKAQAPAGSTISDKMQKALGKAATSAKSKVKPAIARVTPSATAVAAKPVAPNLAAPSTEAEAMTVFGRRADKVGGKPRYLGLALVGVLLAVLLGIAIWAATVLDPPRDAQVTPTDTQAVDTAAATEAAPEDTAAIPAEASETPAPPSTTTAEQPAATASLSSAGEVDELTLPTPDATVGEAPQTQLAATSAATGDTAPAPASALPEFGALFKFDAQGNILPSAEGVMTPDGVMLVTGRPRVIPPQRPESVTAAAAPAASSTALPEPPADSAAVPLTPGAIALSPQVTPTPEATANAVAADVAAGPFQPDTTYAAYRPRQRPADIAPAAVPDPATDATLPAEEGALPEEGSSADDSQFVSRRPAARPAQITQAAAAAETERNRQLAEASAAAAAAASTVAAASAQDAVQLANIPGRRPAARPSNFAAAPAVQTASVAAPTGAARALQQTEIEEDEPPVTTRAAPNIPTRASVARQATVNRGINLGRINLLGVFGTANSRHALVRESGGRLVKVRVGDRLDGGQVVAISQSEVRYQKRGQTVSLSMPRG